MYHWFLLCPKPDGSSSSTVRSVALNFLNRGGSLTTSLNSSERRKLFWLGAIEFIPVLSGGIGAAYFDSGVVGGSLIVAGFVLCAITCWLLRDQTPKTR